MALKVFKNGHNANRGKGAGFKTFQYQWEKYYDGRNTLLLSFSQPSDPFSNLFSTCKNACFKYTYAALRFFAEKSTAFVL